jgi:SAM-dependent methyltransferase
VGGNISRQSKLAVRDRPPLDQTHLEHNLLADLRHYYKNSVGYREHLELKGPNYFQRFVADICACSSASDLILDVGCGTGESTVEIGRRGRRVVGTDISNLFLQRKANSKHCPFVASDASSLPFPDETFDLVCAMEFIEHVWPVDVILGEMVRVLKPAGRIVLASPNLLSPLWPIRDFPRMLFRREFRPPLYSSYLEALGFFCQSTYATFSKMFSRTPQFTARRPDLGQADSGGDFDAVYCSNARDITLFLRRLDFEVKLHGGGRARVGSFVRSSAAKLMGSLWTSFALVATKPDLLIMSRAANQ